MTMRKLFTGLGLIATAFVLMWSAGFQAFVFWRLFLHQRLLIWDDSRFFNWAEMMVASFIAIAGLIVFLWVFRFVVTKHWRQREK